jgi:hypothetical protein
MMFSGKNTVLRKMGFLSDQEGIINRYIREEGAWDPHLNKTRKFILDSVKGKTIQTIAVLGSGWLLDVPLEELTEQYEKVLLIDIFHPPQIVHKAKAYLNVKLIDEDLTGGTVQDVYSLVRSFKRSGKKKSIEKIVCSEFKPEYKVDYYVSVNLLNQLDILIIDYLKKYNIYSDKELLELRRHIQKCHLDSLPFGKSCMITDYEEWLFKEDFLEKKNPLIYIKLPDGKRKTTWEWEFDTKMEYNKGRKTVFNVVAIEL